MYVANRKVRPGKAEKGGPVSRRKIALVWRSGREDGTEKKKIERRKGTRPMERKDAAPARLFVYLDIASDIARSRGLQLVQPIMAARWSLGRLKHRLERSL